MLRVNPGHVFNTMFSALMGWIVGCVVVFGQPPWALPDRQPPQAPTDVAQQIRIISCREGNEIEQGTAEVVAPNTWITAAHVIGHSRDCSVDGRKLTPVNVSKTEDFAVLSGSSQGVIPLHVNCDESETRTTYYAYGFANGNRLTIVSLDSRGKFAVLTMNEDNVEIMDENVRNYIGNTIEGMSGGPIVDAHGDLMAITLSGEPDTPATSGRELHDTVLCKGEGINT